MESMMNLPDDMFKQEILHCVTVYDIVKLDNACMNHKYRLQLLEKINGVILTGDKDKPIKASLFKWLGMRRIYLINMYLRFIEDDNSFSSSIENDYVDQFRYTQHVVMRGPIRDNMAIFIISHCSCLLSIDISGEFNHSRVTDHTLQSLADHCTGLQSLSLSDCRKITDTGLVIISMNCTNLKSLKIYYCNKITDASIISISIYCSGLLSLNLRRCKKITNASIISLSTHCTGLLSLNLYDCDHISDASIISISTHCTGLLSLNLDYCNRITDASIISLSTHCSGLQSLNLYRCHQITDASIISISEHCTGMKKLEVSETAITDASLIAIAKNCTGLQYLNTYRCKGLVVYHDSAG